MSAGPHLLARWRRRLALAVMGRRLQQLHGAIHQAERNLAHDETTLALLRMERLALQQRMQYAQHPLREASAPAAPFTWGL